MKFGPLKSNDDKLIIEFAKPRINSTMLLQEIKTTDLDPSKKHLFVLPMGATEQHGPFLPLGTDTYIQQAIIGEVAGKFADAYFLPTLSITCSREHEGFPGTIWLSEDTLFSVMADACRSLEPYAHTIAFVSWHGGNISAIHEFVAQRGGVFGETKLAYIELDTPEVMKKTEELLGGPVDEHAGNSEVCMMLAIKKDLVEIPSKNYPKRKIENPWGAERLAEVSLDGIVDNHPTWVADSSAGQTMIGFASEALANALKALTAKKI